MTVGYTADEILQKAAKEIEKEATQKINFQVEISTATVGGCVNPECGFEVSSACVIRIGAQQFLVAYAKTGSHQSIISGIIAIRLDQNSYAVGFEKNLHRIMEKTNCKFDDCLREYLNQKFNGDPNDPNIQAKTLIRQYRFSKAAIISASKSGSFIIDDKENWYMTNIAKNNGYLGYAVALQESNGHNGSSFRYNGALARTISEDIIKFIDILAK